MIKDELYGRSVAMSVWVGTGGMLKEYSHFDEGMEKSTFTAEPK